MTTPIFLNTGGGVFGAIRARVAEDANLRDAFGDRVKPGRFRSGTADFPYIEMLHLPSPLDELFIAPKTDNILPDFYDVWRDGIQISIYADSYEACRQLGRLFHARISRQTLIADCQEINLFPDNRFLQQDPQKIKTSADVWHYDFKYHFWIADKLLPDQYQASEEPS